MNLGHTSFVEKIVFKRELLVCGFAFYNLRSHLTNCLCLSVLAHSSFIHLFIVCVRTCERVCVHVCVCVCVCVCVATGCKQLLKGPVVSLPAVEGKITVFIYLFHLHHVEPSQLYCSICFRRLLG